MQAIFKSAQHIYEKVEGSGSVPLTNGSGSGRPKTISVSGSGFPTLFPTLYYAVCTADELEREEFYRLKKVQDKKKKIRKEKEALAAERKARGKGEYYATSGFASSTFFIGQFFEVFLYGSYLKNQLPTS